MKVHPVEYLVIIDLIFMLENAYVITHSDGDRILANMDISERHGTHV